MDVSSIARLASDMQANQLQQQVGTAVLRRALDMQATSAAQLLQALPEVGAAQLPPHLGQNVNTTA